MVFFVETELQNNALSRKTEMDWKTFLVKDICHNTFS